MKYEINIWDCGTGSKVTVETGGKLTVIDSGGCPAEDILAGLRPYRDSEKLARVVLRRWMRGYDGSPRGNGLCVEVSDADGWTLARVAA